MSSAKAFSMGAAQTGTVLSDDMDNADFMGVTGV
jgi:hypothetical protein